MRLKKYRTHVVNNKLKNDNALGSFPNSNVYNNINININVQQLDKEEVKNKYQDDYFKGKETKLEPSSKENIKSK